MACKIPHSYVKKIDMKTYILLAIAMLVLSTAISSCGGDDPRAAEQSKRQRLKIKPTGYEEMTEEEVELEQKAYEREAEPAGDGL